VKIIPIWLQAVIGAVIVAALFGAGWRVAAWKASGKIERLTAERDAAVLERDEKRAFAEACVADIKKVADDLTAMAAQREELQRLYDEATSKPPTVVIKYRDRWHDAEDAVTSEDCPTAVVQAVEFLHTLPGWGGGG